MQVKEIGRKLAGRGIREQVPMFENLSQIFYII